jgi:hypothetical protein
MRVDQIAPAMPPIGKTLAKLGGRRRQGAVQDQRSRISI